MRVFTKEMSRLLEGGYRVQNRVSSTTEPPIFEDDTVVVRHKAPRIKEGVVRIR